MHLPLKINPKRDGHTALLLNLLVLRAGTILAATGTVKNGDTQLVRDG